MDNTDPLSIDALCEKQQRRLIKLADLMLDRFEAADTPAQEVEVGRSAQALLTVIKVVRESHVPLKKLAPTQKADHDLHDDDDDDDDEQPGTAATLEARQRELEHRILRFIEHRRGSVMDPSPQRKDDQTADEKLDILAPPRANPSIRSLA